MTAWPGLAQDAYSCTHVATVGVKGLKGANCVNAADVMPAAVAYSSELCAVVMISLSDQWRILNVQGGGGEGVEGLGIKVPQWGPGQKLKIFWFLLMAA